MSTESIKRQFGRLSREEQAELQSFIEDWKDPHTITLDQLTPRRDKLFIVFQDPKYRPPILDEMMPDIENVIFSIAKKYTDQSCPALHTDELVGEGRMKLAKCITDGWMDRAQTRVEFFKILKTAVNNHVKGLVHAHRFTVKRTGQKPPPRDQRFLPGTSQASTKPVEISLDDPESHLQVGEDGAWDDAHCDLEEDIMSVLSPLERLVLRQQVDPNAETLCYATVDAHFNRKPGSVDIRIKDVHQAQGIGISVELWRQCVESIKQKTIRMQEEELNPQKNAAIQQLATIFNVQVPRSLDMMVVRRLFTLAARDNAELVNSQVVDLLRLIGARPPEVRHSGTVACFGVLFKQNHQSCANCGLKVACEAECANYGLSSITVDQRMLGSRGVRTPMLTASAPASSEAVVRDSVARGRDTEVLSYVTEHFTSVRYDKWTYFKHKQGGSKSVFRVESGENALSGQVSFCKPSDALKPRLEKQRKGSYFVPAGLSYDEAVELVNEHASQTLKS